MRWAGVGKLNLKGKKTKGWTDGVIPPGKDQWRSPLPLVLFGMAPETNRRLFGS